MPTGHFPRDGSYRPSAGDPLTRRELLVAAGRAVKQLARDTEGIAAVIGCPEYHIA